MIIITTVILEVVLFAHKAMFLMYLSRRAHLIFAVAVHLTTTQCAGLGEANPASRTASP